MARQKHNKSKKARTKAYDPKAYLRNVANIEARNAVRRAHAVAREREAHMRLLMTQEMSAEHIEDISLAFHLSFEALRKGAGTENDMDAVGCALNIALVLCGNGHGKEYEPAVVSALDGVFRAKLRAKSTGRWAFDGDAIRAIEYAMEVHAAQLEVVMRGDLVQAIDEVNRRIAAGEVYSEIQAAAAAGAEVEAEAA